MKLQRGLIVGLACVAIAGCGKSGEPSGQVIATVDGQEITSNELKAELGGFTTADPKLRKAAEQVALQRIVIRKALARAAEKQKIDRTPAFAQAAQRQKDTLLVQSWQARLASAVPAPNAEEGQRYVSEHPELYAQRKVYNLDQIRTIGGADPHLLDKLKPLNTLEEVSALLQAEKLPFQRSTDQLDPLNVDDRLMVQLQKLPPGELFIVPLNGVMTINRVVDAQPAPAPADVATKNALQRLRNERTQQAVQNAFGQAMQQMKTKIKYAKGYEPPSASAKPSPKAGV